jgi:hypothetical protein
VVQKPQRGLAVSLDAQWTNISAPLRLAYRLRLSPDVFDKDNWVCTWTLTTVQVPCRAAERSPRCVPGACPGTPEAPTALLEPFSMPLRSSSTPPPPAVGRLAFISLLPISSSKWLSDYGVSAILPRGFSGMAAPAFVRRRSRWHAKAQESRRPAQCPVQIRG